MLREGGETRTACARRWISASCLGCVVNGVVFLFISFFGSYPSASEGTPCVPRPVGCVLCRSLFSLVHLFSVHLQLLMEPTVCVCVCVCVCVGSYCLRRGVEKVARYPCDAELRFRLVISGTYRTCGPSPIHRRWRLLARQCFGAKRRTRTRILSACACLPDQVRAGVGLVAFRQL